MYEIDDGLHLIFENVLNTSQRLIAYKKSIDDLYTFIANVESEFGDREGRRKKSVNLILYTTFAAMPNAYKRNLLYNTIHYCIVYANLTEFEKCVYNG